MLVTEKLIQLQKNLDPVFRMSFTEDTAILRLADHEPKDMYCTVFGISRVMTYTGLPK